LEFNRKKKICQRRLIRL